MDPENLTADQAILLQTWQHHKRPTIRYAELWAPQVMFYVALDGTGSVYWRPSSEFYDGRFRPADKVKIETTGIRRG